MPRSTALAKQGSHFQTLLVVLVCVWVSAPILTLQGAVIVNGSFENGFNGWITNDLASPQTPLQVAANGFNNGFFFSTQATDGQFSLVSGFDGAGPGTISFAQDVGTVDVTSHWLSFDYRAAWQMLPPDGSTQDRTFNLVIEPGGGGPAIGDFSILTAKALTSDDTGFQSPSLDLSQYMGEDIRLSFEFFIPESFTGPGFMEVDNIQLSDVPEPSTFVLSGAFAAGLGVFRLVRTRRRIRASRSAPSMLSRAPE